MIFPIYVNSIHLFIDSNHELKEVDIVYAYLGFLSTFAYLYFSVFMINPKCHESDQDFKKYIKTPHFIMFNGFYNGLTLKTW